MVVKPCSSFFAISARCKKQTSANNKTTGLSRSQIIMSRHALSASILMSLKHKKQPYKGKHKQTNKHKREPFKRLNVQKFHKFEHLSNNFLQRFQCFLYLCIGKKILTKV